MKNKFLLFSCAALLFGLAAMNAHADSFVDGTLNFTVTAGGPAPTGSFVYDTTTDELTSYTVEWDGATYNLVADFSGFSLAEYELGGFWCAAAPANSTSPCGVPPGDVVLNGLGQGNATIQTFTDRSAGASGTYTVSETPEIGRASCRERV